MDFVLTRDQDEAIKRIEEWYLRNDTQVFTLSGNAGTGKSTVISMVAKRLDIKQIEIAYATLSGKAAVVLQNKGMNARTIHNMIYHKVGDENNKPRFEKRKYLDGYYKLIVIDEFSMVSEKIHQDLLSFGIKILVVGDKAQLPPIDEETSLLTNPDYHMSEIVRQAAQSPILKLSQMILHDVELKRGTIGDSVYICYKDQIPTETLLQVDQILCGQNKTRHSLNMELREHLGRTDIFPEAGDKLICIKNNWNHYVDGVPLINGMMGVCNRIKHTSDNDMLINFKPDFTERAAELRSAKRPFLVKNDPFGRDVERDKQVELDYLDFGYAITVHKAQGSEYDNVIVYKDWMPYDKRKRWLYTAVTRAKKKIVIGL